MRTKNIIDIEYTDNLVQLGQIGMQIERLKKHSRLVQCKLAALDEEAAELARKPVTEDVQTSALDIPKPDALDI